jgi:hypothetical protein
MAKRAGIVIVATWVGLILVYLAPSALPETWQYSIYSPGSAALWMLAMVVGPAVACSVKRDWIRHSAPRR